MKKSNLISFSVALLVSVFASNVFGQSKNAHEMHASDTKTSWKLIMSKALTDSGLVNKKIQASEYILAPGHADTVTHRHAAEVFIYVVEGSIEHRRAGNAPTTILQKGEILHEMPYSLHSLTRNPSATEAAKLFIMFIYTDGPGAPRFLREYPKK
ncbi:MAG TPA: cupin domain-containing protein [Pedobacter sp.]|jgi:quercetin dioxygenase-like cupin family protein